MQFVVKRQYGRERESVCETFAHSQEAKKYIQSELNKATAMNTIVKYFLCNEHDEVVGTFKPGDIILPDESSDQSQQGQSNASSFKPTPLNMAPRPAGMPQNWVKDDDKDSKK